MISNKIIEDDHDHHIKKDDVPAVPKVGILASHGSMYVCGRRREMEDAVTVIPGLLPSSTTRDHDFDFFAVFDGHGGSAVANLCSEQLHKILVNEIQGSPNLDKIDWENVMVSCFLKMDEKVVSGKEVEHESIKSIGSTAVVALISKDEIIVANCGDSRVVLSRAGSPITLSQDHKMRKRIEAAGGTVIDWDGSRVLGVLATSRSIDVSYASAAANTNFDFSFRPGDRYLKPYVTFIPEVTITSRTESDEFVILASDGLWDMMSNKIARRCLEGRVARGSSSPSDHASNAALAAAFLTEVSMAKGSCRGKISHNTFVSVRDAIISLTCENVA
ncbi:hypothetical protein MKW92_044144 [Papaver armeniacum]|nr:hypothetical protein MKW92_044144 [Papaver armeniacum]